jgi:hypothetical protein
MKFNIEVECTPQEFRQLVGLPDLQPMQERLLTEMEERFSKSFDKMSPENLISQWFNMWPEHMRKTIDTLAKNTKS